MKKNEKNSGFTLIEMLVVIFVVSVGLVGALSFFNINLSNQFEVKNELIAAGLAQEGVDLVRNIADYNSLGGLAKWYTNLTNSQGGGTLCRNIDYLSLESHKCNASTLTNNVCLNSEKRYRQCNDSVHTFERAVVLSGYDADLDGSYNLDDQDCLRVLVTVTWNGRKTEASDIICKPR